VDGAVAFGAQMRMFGDTTARRLLQQRSSRNWSGSSATPKAVGYFRISGMARTGDFEASRSGRPESLSTFPAFLGNAAVRNWQRDGLLTAGSGSSPAPPLIRKGRCVSSWRAIGMTDPAPLQKPCVRHPFGGQPGRGSRATCGRCNVSWGGVAPVCLGARSAKCTWSHRSPPPGLLHRQRRELTCLCLPTETRR